MSPRSRCFVLAATKAALPVDQRAPLRRFSAVLGPICRENINTTPPESSRKRTLEEYLILPVDFLFGYRDSDNSYS